MSLPPSDALMDLERLMEARGSCGGRIREEKSTKKQGRATELGFPTRGGVVINSCLCFVYVSMSPLVDTRGM